ncbi:MAG: glycolate oxidase iron-sulfur subunit, partial [Candidatus Fonsibacter sp.]
MQTKFNNEQLQDRNIVESEKILRKCVHCGFCNSTCPTYLVAGN